jgi:Mlc titration factor MtfA (ptsG expression regulator)
LISRPSGTKKDHPLPSEMEVTDEVFEKYSLVIGSLFTYFNDLPQNHKRKFVQRVHQFKADKRFHFIGLEENDDIAILVSASAIQVTFGLRNYMMSYFKDIHILADAYQTGAEEEFYIGHVSPDGIYLSLKHFLYGYMHNGSDNTNVAVHEMAHALVYNNFFNQYGIDPHFRLNYEKFSSTTGPILADVITNRRSYLRSYAFSNMHEFWAVSVEAFFINPEGLKKNMPELFEVLCRVLNQDPCTKSKLIA